MALERHPRWVFGEDILFVIETQRGLNLNRPSVSLSTVLLPDGKRV